MEGGEYAYNLLIVSISICISICMSMSMSMSLCRTMLYEDGEYASDLVDA